MIPVIYPNYYPHQTTYNKRDNVATIVTTKVGTFSSTWKGTGTLYFDPGDGGPIEPLVLTTGGVYWDHEYPLAGSKAIRITGDLGGATYLAAMSNNIVNYLDSIISGLINLTTLDLRTNSIPGSLSAVSKLTNLSTLYASGNLLTDGISAVSGLINLVNLSLFNNSLTDDIAAISGLINLNSLYLFGNALSFTYAQFPAWSGNTYDISSTVSTSQEVGDLIRAAANGGMNNCIYKLDGTNPAPPSTQEVLDGIDTLAGNGVTLYVST